MSNQPSDISDIPAQRPILLLWGMSGSGKSSVAPLVAAGTGARSIDLDDCIVEATGSSIAAIFGERGEGAFRELERQLLSGLLSEDTSEARVIALGGGALMDEALRARALRECFVVVLSAPLPVLAQRVRMGSDRPLLNMGPLADRLRTLLRAREAAYGEGHVHLDTGVRSLVDVAKAIAALWWPQQRV